MRLFVYGELCRAAVLRQNLERLPVAALAMLPEHARRRNLDSGYFEVQPTPGAQVAGMLLQDLSATELLALDELEKVGTGLYQRVKVRVRPLGSQSAHVEAYAYLGGHTRGAA